MKGLIYAACLLVLPMFSFSQRITFSETQKEDNRDINFDVIGKIKNNIIIFKNAKGKYAVSVYDPEDMTLKEKIDLDFIPDKAFNVDYISFGDNFYFIYQYQKKSVIYCMGAKMDFTGHIIDKPLQLDTTHVGAMGDNKIYSTINSDDKKRIMIFKIQKKNDQFNFVTILLDNQLQQVHKSRLRIDFDDHDEVFSDFLLDNDGNFVFSKAVKTGNKSNFGALYLFTKAALADTFSIKKLKMNGLFIDEVKIKVDNINKQYLLNSFYYSEKRGNIEGVYCAVWDIKSDSAVGNVFTRLDESVRELAKTKGNVKQALNDYFIRAIILKRDGNFLLVAEDFSSQSSGYNNDWNRYNYLYGSPYMNPYNYYNYNPSYGSYYRPYNNYNTPQSTRYFYDNILLLEISKKGDVLRDRVINKEQYADDTDNFLSFNTFVSESSIHFLYNIIEKKEKLLTATTVSSDGSVKRNPTLRSIDRGYEFMPKLSKQIGAKQIIVPCTFRNQICFAKIDF